MYTKFLWAVAGSLSLFGAYLIGYATSPGPYIPAEDSYRYSNHHCVPIQTIEFQEIWGN